MKKLIYLAILITSTLIIVFNLFFNNTYENEQDYLSKNNKKLDLSDVDDFSGLDILYKDLKYKKIVLAGEIHHLDKNHLIEFKLLKYLQDKIGVNYYLAELGYSMTHFINKYLESGDEEYLNIIFKCFENKRIDNENFQKTFKKVYKLNQTLPEDEQIRYVGIDLEPTPEMTNRYIKDVLADEIMMTDDLKTLINELEKPSYNSENQLNSTKDASLKVLEDIKENEEVYKKMLQEEFEGFNHVIQNIVYRSDAFLAHPTDWNNLRDKLIYDNFKAIDNSLDNPVYFGQWGVAHIYQDTALYNIGEQEEEFLGSYLNKDEKYKGKVLSIQYGYYNTGLNSHTGNAGYIDIELFREYLDIKEDGVLFKLNSKNSPFSERHINVFSNDSIKFFEKPNTNFYQYMLLIKDSHESKHIN